MRPLRPPRATLWTALSLAAVLAAVPAGAAEPFSHADWERVLERFVDARGFVDYQGLAEDRGALDRYLARLRAASPESDPGLFPSPDHELAYWINAYNAWVFWGVLDRGPDLDSVWGFLGTGISFFSGMDIELGGRETNLKALEDEVIRARYGERDDIDTVSRLLNGLVQGISIQVVVDPARWSPDQIRSVLEAQVRMLLGSPEHL